MLRNPGIWTIALLSGWLTACTTSPSSLELDSDGVPGRPPSDATWGPTTPGHTMTGFGDSDWRYGEFLPPQVNPEPIPEKLDFNQQIDSSPWGAKVSDFPVGDEADTDFFIMGTSEDDAKSDGEAGEGQGVAGIRIPF